MGAPEVVIEVLSPSNTMDVCLNHGSIAFWTVDPKRKTVMLTTVDRVTGAYNSTMKAPLPSTIAESFIHVAEIFE